MAIMISIQPQHCENILNLIKTLEIRKSCPKEWKDYLSGKTKVKPKAVKVYIYCTKGNRNLYIPQEFTAFECDDASKPYFAKQPILEDIDYLANGRVVACFTLNEVEEIKHFTKELQDISKVSPRDFFNYKGNKRTYAWHIDDLKIYDMPRELGEFYTICKEYNCCYCPYHYHENNASIGIEEFCMSDGLKPLTRPFQSWGYCEELEEL